MSTRQIIKRLARVYMAEYGDTARHAMKNACAFLYGCERILGGHVPAIGAKWADQRAARGNRPCQT